MTEELKPCPFCASADLYWYQTNRGRRIAVKCRGCGGQSRGCDSQAEAAGLWDARPSSNHPKNYSSFQAEFKRLMDEP